MDSIFNNIMTPLSTVVVAHSPIVVTALLGAIILCVFGLMLISFHSPKDAMAHEMGNVERIEGVLRQILSEQNWPTVKTPEAKAAVEAEPVVLDAEAASSDAAPIAAAPVAAAAADPTAPAAPAESNPEMDQLQTKIKELEEKLAEYSVIEEDIADLSKFRQENDELKRKITHATGVPAEQAVTMPWDDFEKVVKDKGAAPAKDSVATSIEKTE